MQSSGGAFDEAPTPDEVADLYAAATQGPPLSESCAQAVAYADLFRHVLARGDSAWVASRVDERLVGFAYGHHQRWAVQTDQWSSQLRERLGAAAPRLENSFAVYLLTVHPLAQRAGLGRRLLEGLLTTAGASRGWLQTRDEETPARIFYRAVGWTEIGHGPDAPNGHPGLVLGLDLPAS